MSTAKAPRWRRAAGPILLSLAAHGLLVSLLGLLPTNPPARPFTTEVIARPLVLSIGALQAPRARPAVRDEGLPIDVVPRVVPAPVDEVPAEVMGAPSPGPEPPSGAGASEGASGGGRGPARPNFFTVPASARSVVYVVDRSISMGPSGAWNAARTELLASLRTLPPTTRFQVVPYDRTAAPLLLRGQTGLVEANAEAVEEAAMLLVDIRPSGGTDHGRALRCGLALRPEVLYFVTDADELRQEEVRAVARCNTARTAIHVIELSPARAEREGSLLRQLAAENRGTYRRVRP